MDNQNRQDYSTNPSGAGVDVAAFIKLLWANRLWLIVTVFGAAFVAAVASLVVEKTFEASSKLKVQVPRYREESVILPPPLSVLGFNDLLNSDEAIYEVLENVKRLRGSVLQLREKGLSIDEIEQKSTGEIASLIAMPTEEAQLLANLAKSDIQGLLAYRQEELDSLRFNNFKRGFESRTAVEKETGLEMEHSPIIDLLAEANHPNKAALLANLWAFSFVYNINKALSQNVAETVEETLAIAKRAREQYEQATDALEDFRERTGIDKLKHELETKNITLFGVTTTGEPVQNQEGEAQQEEVNTENFQNAFMPQLQTVKKSIKSTERLLALVSASLQPREVDGIWIGDVPLDPQKSQEELSGLIEDVSSFMQKTLERMETATPATEIRGEIEQLRQRIETQREYVRSLQDQVESQRRHADEIKELNNLRGRLAELENRLFEIHLDEQRVEGARSAMATLKVRDRFLAASDRLQDITPATWLQSEIELINDQIRSANEQIAITQRGEGATTEGGVNLEQWRSFYLERLESLQKEKKRLQNYYQQAQQSETMVARQVEDASVALGFYRRAYLDSKQTKQEMETQLQQYRGERTGLNESISQTREQIDTLSNKIAAAEAKMESLQNEKDSYEKALQAFSPRLSEAVAERMQRGKDIQVMARAVPPDRRVSPRRSLWVLSAALVMFIVDIGYLIFRRLLIA